MASGRADFLNPAALININGDVEGDTTDRHGASVSFVKHGGGNMEQTSCVMCACFGDLTWLYLLLHGDKKGSAHDQKKTIHLR